MLHMKRKETKQQPATAGQGSLLGCCLVSLRFLCAIHSFHTVKDVIHGSSPRRVLVARREGGRGGWVAAGHAAPGPGLALPARAEGCGGAEQADAAVFTDGGEECDFYGESTTVESELYPINTG